jgi:ankyrin repeat protein
MKNFQKIQALSTAGSRLTPLHAAALFGQKDVADFLVQKKAEINSTDNGGGTALHYAAMEGHKDIVELPLNRQLLAFD